jgi:hypothetical protein
MRSAETIKAIKGLSEQQRQRALQLQAQLETIQAQLEAILRQSESQPGDVDLPSRSIGEAQAADLRARLKTFAEDWDRPEAAAYDQSSPR